MKVSIIEYTKVDEIENFKEKFVTLWSIWFANSIHPICHKRNIYVWEKNWIIYSISIYIYLVKMMLDIHIYILVVVLSGDWLQKYELISSCLKSYQLQTSPQRSKMDLWYKCQVKFVGGFHKNKTTL